MLELGALGAKALLFGGAIAARFRRGPGGDWEEPVELGCIAAGPPAEVELSTDCPQALDPIELTPVRAEADAMALRLPLEAEQACIEIGMPPDPAWTGKPCNIYDGPLRARDTDSDAARRFVVWVQATTQTGEWRVKRIRAMYAEFCELDHRPQVADRIFLKALKATRGVSYHRREENCSNGTYEISAARTVAVSKRATGKPRKGRIVEPQRIMTAQVIDLGEAAGERLKAKAARSKALRRKQRARATRREAA